MPPQVAGMPDIRLPVDSVFTLALDNFVSDADNYIDDLTWDAEIITHSSTAGLKTVSPVMRMAQMPVKATRIDHNWQSLKQFRFQRYANMQNEALHKAIDAQDNLQDLRIEIDSETRVASFTCNPSVTRDKIYSVIFTATDPYGLSDGDTILVSIITAVSEPASAGLPDNYALGQNYPNPFNPTTRISYALPVPGKVKLVVYNMQGQLVRILVDEQRPVGHHIVSWQGRDQADHSVASGIYYIALQVERGGQRVFEASRKTILLK